MNQATPLPELPAEVRAALDQEYALALEAWELGDRPGNDDQANVARRRNARAQTEAMRPAVEYVLSAINAIHAYVDTLGDGEAHAAALAEIRFELTTGIQDGASWLGGAL